jgi:undecaprenyl-diphosphatase
MSIDTDLLIWITQTLHHPTLDVFFSWVSARWSFAFPLFALLLLDSLRRCGKAGLLLALSLALTVGAADFTGNILKNAFAEPRPCVVHKELGERFGGCTNDHKGMPSNHTLNFVTAAMFITLMTKWRTWQIGLWIIAMLVGLSRIYLIKHYPSQVLAGGMLGIAFGSAGWLVFHVGLKWQRFTNKSQPQENHDNLANSDT